MDSSAQGQLRQTGGHLPACPPSPGPEPWPGLGERGVVCLFPRLWSRPQSIAGAGVEKQWRQLV